MHHRELRNRRRRGLPPSRGLPLRARLAASLPGRRHRRATCHLRHTKRHTSRTPDVLWNLNKSRTCARVSLPVLEGIGRCCRTLRLRRWNQGLPPRRARSTEACYCNARGTAFGLCPFSHFQARSRRPLDCAPVSKPGRRARNVNNHHRLMKPSVIEFRRQTPGPGRERHTR